ncbi:MAG TPA: DedA family protein [Bacteroidota bacterium]|jgi:membrane protein DedA with SNARE-associated domain
MELISVWISDYGYIGISTLLMLGIVGIPVPDETLLTFSGYLVYKQQLTFHGTLAAAFLGSVCGITISYGLGRLVGLYLIQRYGKFLFVTPERLAAAHRWFLLRGKWTLPIGYFIPGVRHLTAYVAGASRLELPKFALYAYSGALIWSTSFILLGYSLGDQWEYVLTKIEDNLVIGTIVAVIVLALLWIVKKWVFRNSLT